MSSGVDVVLLQGATQGLSGCPVNVILNFYAATLATLQAVAIAYIAAKYSQRSNAE